MLGFIFGIGRWLKSLLDLYLKHWKITIPATLLVVGFFVVSDHYYDKGVATERAVWEQRIADEEEKNAKLTQELADATLDFERKLAEAEGERIVEERIIYRDIERIIENSPELQQCEINPDINDYLNDLKALGPQGEN